MIIDVIDPFLSCRRQRTLPCLKRVFSDAHHGHGVQRRHRRLDLRHHRQLWLALYPLVRHRPRRGGDRARLAAVLVTPARGGTASVGSRIPRTPAKGYFGPSGRSTNLRPLGPVPLTCSTTSSSI